MFILASASPRRRELLKQIVPVYEVIASNIDEGAIRGPIAEIPLRTAKAKAYPIFAAHPEDTILACDTVVVIDHEILGKPKDAADAKRMLHQLSGRRHKVISGYVILSGTREISRSVVTDVWFNPLSEALIEAYVATGSPMDKAGAYGIQDEAFHLIDRIVGSRDNVMGLPTEDIAKHLAK